MLLKWVVRPSFTTVIAADEWWLWSWSCCHPHSQKWRNIHNVNRKKSPWKNLGIIAVGIVRESRKFSGHPVPPTYRAHCAVIFALSISKLICKWGYQRSKGYNNLIEVKIWRCFRKYPLESWIHWSSDLLWLHLVEKMLLIILICNIDALCLTELKNINQNMS